MRFVNKEIFGGVVRTGFVGKDEKWFFGFSRVTPPVFGCIAPPFAVERFTYFAFNNPDEHIAAMRQKAREANAKKIVDFAFYNMDGKSIEIDWPELRELLIRREREQSRGDRWGQYLEATRMSFESGALW